MTESYSGETSRGGDDTQAEALRATRHALNDAVTALLAEAQLLELEPLEDEHLHAVGRIVELARRVARMAGQLGGAGD